MHWNVVWVQKFWKARSCQYLPIQGLHRTGLGTQRMYRLRMNHDMIDDRSWSVRRTSIRKSWLPSTISKLGDIEWIWQYHGLTYAAAFYLHWSAAESLIYPLNGTDMPTNGQMWYIIYVALKYLPISSSFFVDSRSWVPLRSSSKLLPAIL